MNKFKKIFLILFLIIGIILTTRGLFLEIPNDYIAFPTKYVGGDAYNYIIESSILGNKIASIRIEKVLYICSGMIILCLTYFIFCNLSQSKKNDLLSNEQDNIDKLNANFQTKENDMSKK